MIELRYYQKEAKIACYDFWRKNPTGNALLSLATGTGKSICIADITKDIIELRNNTRVLILSHVAEILEQNAQKIHSLYPEAPIGIYSASLRQKKFDRRIVVAGIQSVYKKAAMLGWFSLVIIDESHLLGDKDDGMYRFLLSQLRNINPQIRILGLSATPWRTKGGLLTQVDNPLFDEVVYTYSIRRAVDDGYLCPLVSKHSKIQADLSGVSTKMGEFNLVEMESAIDNEALTNAALDEVLQYGMDRKSWLIFCSGVNHANHVTENLLNRGIETALITGKTSIIERESIIRMFKNGERYRAICNNAVLTTGTDIPRIDLLVFLRGTKSAGLMLQMAGRGMRLSPETLKNNCLILDYAGNLERFGCIDQINAPNPRIKKDSAEMPIKFCPICDSGVPISTMECPDCGYVYLKDETYKHATIATNAPAMSNDGNWFIIDETTYKKHPGKIKNIELSDGTVERKINPPTLQVTYLSGTRVFKEWVCLEHKGFAKSKALTWISRRLVTDPDASIEQRYEQMEGFTIDDAVRFPDYLIVPIEIKVVKNGKYEQITSYKF